MAGVVWDELAHEIARVATRTFPASDKRGVGPYAWSLPNTAPTLGEMGQSNRDSSRAFLLTSGVRFHFQPLLEEGMEQSLK